MATQAQQLEQALKLARAKGYTVEVSPSVKRQSLVENYRTPRRRNDLSERVNSLNWEQLADPTQPLPENTTVEQLLKDFSLLYLYKTGAYDHLEER